MARDISDRKKSQQLIARELTHRTQNLFDRARAWVPLPAGNPKKWATPDFKKAAKARRSRYHFDASRIDRE